MMKRSLEFRADKREPHPAAPQQTTAVCKQHLCNAGQKPTSIS